MISRDQTTEVHHYNKIEAQLLGHERKEYSVANESLDRICDSILKFYPALILMKKKN